MFDRKATVGRKLISMARERECDYERLAYNAIGVVVFAAAVSVIACHDTESLALAVGFVKNRQA